MSKTNIDKKQLRRTKLCDELNIMVEKKNPLSFFLKKSLCLKKITNFYSTYIKFGAKDTRGRVNDIDDRHVYEHTLYLEY